jgi:pimeloyl-ACP methyl ester carboxylesterase
MSDDLSAPAADPDLRSPLARFDGAAPPAPAWFTSALAEAPERRFIEVEGAKLELLTWGEVGKPGLLFLHGGRAHADWWSFIAPFFATDYRVAALSWSGMGRSDWRDSYTAELWTREALGAIEAGGLDRGPEKPLLVAHSFGGLIAMSMAAHRSDRLKAVVLLDCGVRPPDDPAQPLQGVVRPPRPNRVYATLEDALAHFRLAPTQRCDHPYILDYIAREGLKLEPAPDGIGAQGWTWRFDPYLFTNVHKTFHSDIAAAFPAAGCPLALIWGDRSALFEGRLKEQTLAIAPAGTPRIAMPEAGHHLFLDQPLGFVACLRSLFAVWPGSGSALSP